VASQRELQAERDRTAVEVSATAKARTDLLGARRAQQAEAASRQQAERTLTKRDAEVKRVTALLSSREKQLTADNATKIADLQRLAKQSESKAVQHAVDKEKATMDQVHKMYKSQLAAKEREIARHVQNHRAVNDDLRKAQDKHDTQMAQMKGQIQQAHSQSQNTLADLAKQQTENQKYISELNAARDAKQLSDAGHAQAMANAEATNQGLVQARSKAKLHSTFGRCNSAQASTQPMPHASTRCPNNKQTQSRSARAKQRGNE